MGNIGPLLYLGGIIIVIITVTIMDAIIHECCGIKPSEGLQVFIRSLLFEESFDIFGIYSLALIGWLILKMMLCTNLHIKWEDVE